MVYFALVPAFNEEKNIEEVILRLRKSPKVNSIVIDDGSTDSTAELVKKLGVTLLRHRTNKGKGEAIKTGFNYILKNHPEAKYIVLIDADMQYLPEEIEKILEPLEKNEAGFVMGYRNWRAVPFRHKLGNFVWRVLFNFIFGTNLKDTNCGYMGFTKNAMKKIKKLYGGYIIENTMLVEAIKNKIKIKQVPVTVVYKHTSKIPRGIRMVAGIWFFIFIEGLKYRLGIKN